MLCIKAWIGTDHSKMRVQCKIAKKLLFAKWQKVLNIYNRGKDKPTDIQFHKELKCYKYIKNIK